MLKANKFPLLGSLLLLATGLATSTTLAQQDAERAAEADIQLPEGFQATLFSGDQLAHDIYCMTLDSAGRVVVCGRGYIRTLWDDDGDGRADRYTTFLDGPAGGAQGMYFDGPDLLCVAGAGLVRYRDRDQDGRADGEPELLFKIKTGGEHHAHSIQRGPDGWWYLLAGNNAGLAVEQIDDSSSPIRQPRAGTLLRFSPDFKNRQVLADGYRNSYDFAFHPQGDVFVFDSDGERDVSLPWYRPTRVFQALIGSHAGWFSRSWKRPDYFFDCAPVVGSFGRGSPTGVTCYRHTHFPAEYHGALLVLDWSFGRVIALPLQPDGSLWKSQPHDFMTARGLFGFAPTDIEVGPEGQVYVSVGGRGTRGGVYCVRWQGQLGDPRSVRTELDDCLAAPQPLSSWSRARWLPLAKKLGMPSLAEAAGDDALPVAMRIRAVEILTELAGGIDDATLAKALASPDHQLQARVAWSLGRTREPGQLGDSLGPLLTAGRHPLVIRTALEALLGGTDRKLAPQRLIDLAGLSVSRDQTIRSLAAQLLARVRLDKQHPLAEAAELLTPDWASSLGDGKQHLTFQPQLVLDIAHRLKSQPPEAQQLVLVRAAQLALGDVGMPGHGPAVFEGYSTEQNLEPSATLMTEVSGILEVTYPTGYRQVDWELGRLLAMLEPDSPVLLEQFVSELGQTPSPVDDLHLLIVLARNRAPRSEQQRQKIAKGLVQLRLKVDQLALKLDNNWDPRLAEMYAVLVKRDPQLPAAVVDQDGFGLSDHVSFVQGLPNDRLQGALDKIAQQVLAVDDYRWTPQLVRLLGRSTRQQHRQLIVDQVDNLAVRASVLKLMAASPEEGNREHFVRGLGSADFAVLADCLRAIEMLPVSRDATELVQLVYNVRRLNHDDLTWKLREQAVRLLRRATEQDFGFVFGKPGHKSQREVVEDWTQYVQAADPQAYKANQRDSEVDLLALRTRLAGIDWQQGDAARGQQLYTKTNCRSCHGSRGALGPDLAGATRRFSRQDLFTAIVAPNRDVSSRYRTTQVLTTTGKLYTGLVVYHSVDGVMLQTGLNETVRVEAEELELQRTVNISLMPTGLLKGLKDQQLADLYAYLQGLK